MNLLRPDRLEPLAREHALGTLTGGARRRFERLLAESPAARRAVLQWQQQLAVLAPAMPKLEPRPAVWSGLERRLFGAPPPPRRGWLGLLAGTLAGGLIASTVLRFQPGWIGLEPAQDKLPASYVGLLADATGQPVLLASARRHGRTLVLKALRPVPAGATVLWALPRDGSPAFAVGALPAGGNGSIELPASAEKLFFGVDRLQLRADGVKLW
jgi:anti-sigma-K factor RskA